MKKTRRVPTQIHTRKLDRGVAKKQMKDHGMMNICHRDGLRGSGRSTFANYWRKFTQYGTKTLA